MKATWDRLEKNWMQFSVEVEADRFRRAIEDTYRKLVRTARIPGFRPGKAPRFIFERYYGKERLLAEAAQALVPEAYVEAVDQGGVEPIDEPEIDLDTLEEGRPLTFRGKVQVKPEVKLGRLSGFGIEEPAVEVTEEEVDRQIQQMRERVAQVVPDEGGEVRAGSYVVVDIEGTVDGQPLPEGKQEGRTIEVGTGRHLPEFENQLLGARVGETRTVEVTYPDDYPDERLRGKKASYTVTVKDLKVRELPELNDELARQLGPYETLQELRSAVENRLRDSARARAERDFRNKVVEAVVAEAEVELPEVLVHRRLHELLDDFVGSLAAQGLTVQTYLKATGQNERELHDRFQEPARVRTKTDLVLEAVAAREGLAVSEAEVDAQIDALAGLYQGQPVSIADLRRSREYRARVRESLLKQKAIDHLVALNRPAAAAEAPAGAGVAGGGEPAPAGAVSGEASGQEPES